MSDPENPYNIQEGDSVYGRDDKKLGSFVGFDQNCLVVERGFFFPSDHYVHPGRVASRKNGAVYLTITRDEALAEAAQAACDAVVTDQDMTQDEVGWDIETGYRVVDVTDKTIARVKDREPEYLTVSVGFLISRTRYIDMRHVSSAGGGWVNLKTTGEQALSKTQPMPQPPIESLLATMSIPPGAYVVGNDDMFVGLVETVWPGKMVFVRQNSRWTIGAEDIDSYDEIGKRLKLTSPSSEYQLERSD